MPIIDLETIPLKSGSSYPATYAAEMGDRAWYPVGEASGLTQYGVNLIVMQPGSKSSMRHWHSAEDEFVMMTQGELVLVTDEGKTLMKPGDCAAFPKGDTNGHHLINESGQEARFLVVGTSDANDTCTYSDVDMKIELKNGKGRFTRKDGSDL